MLRRLNHRITKHLIFLKFRKFFKRKIHRKFKVRYSDFLKRKDAPWFNMAAVEFLDTLDLKKFKVLEFGSGSSTLYFALKCDSVASYELDKKYYKFTRSILEKNSVKNVKLNLYNQIDSELIMSISDSEFSILILDDTNRGKVLRELINLPRLPDIIILDNSDWMPNHLGLLLGRYFIINFIDFPRAAHKSKSFKLNHFATQTSICFNKSKVFPNQISSKITLQPIAGGKVQSKKSKDLDTFEGNRI